MLKHIQNHCVERSKLLSFWCILSISSSLIATHTSNVEEDFWNQVDQIPHSLASLVNSHEQIVSYLITDPNIYTRYPFYKTVILMTGSIVLPLMHIVWPRALHYIYAILYFFWLSAFNIDKSLTEIADTAGKTIYPILTTIVFFIYALFSICWHLYTLSVFSKPENRRAYLLTNKRLIIKNERALIPLFGSEGEIEIFKLRKIKLKEIDQTIWDDTTTSSIRFFTGYYKKIPVYKPKRKKTIRQRAYDPDKGEYKMVKVQEEIEEVERNEYTVVKYKKKPIYDYIYGVPLHAIYDLYREIEENSDRCKKKHRKRKQRKKRVRINLNVDHEE